MSSTTDLLGLLRLLRPWQADFRKLRIGSLGDGGYVMPDDLEAIAGLLSIGVGSEVSFDRYFAERGVPVFQYDHTVEAPPEVHANFRFHRTAWAPADGNNALCLASMVQRHGLGNSANHLLKFDVEGAEWQCLATTSAEYLKPFRLVVCELHGLNGLHNQAFFQLARQILQLLTQNHSVVHLHANNCCGVSLIEGAPVPNVLELTLLRNDRSAFRPATEAMPGALDYPSMTDRPDLVLNPFSAY